MYYIILSIFFPVLMGIYLLVRKEMKNRKNLLITVGIAFIITTVLVILTLCLSGDEMLNLFSLTDFLSCLR